MPPGGASQPSAGERDAFSETSPQAVFDRLFGTGRRIDKQKNETRRSILAFKPMGKSWNTPHYDATGYEMAISHPVVAGRLYLRGADGIYCWDLTRP